jgi:hypothetical protein
MKSDAGLPPGVGHPPVLPPTGVGTAFRQNHLPDQSNT